MLPPRIDMFIYDREALNYTDPSELAASKTGEEPEDICQV